MHSVDLLGKSGAIDFLFLVVGKTKGILFIDRKLVFPIQTTDDWLPGCHNCLMADSSQFSPLNTLSDQLGPNSWVSSVFIPAFIANIGKYFFLKYDQQSFKSI